MSYGGGYNGRGNGYSNGYVLLRVTTFATPSIDPLAD
jgi:hypothetical protein